MIEVDMKKIIEKVEIEKKKMADARDEVRKLYDELAGVVECFDCGVEGLDGAIRDLTDAVDKISEIV